MTLLVARADSRALPLPDASVDLIVTSPPYFDRRSYTDDGTHIGGQIGSEPTPADYVAALVECTREWFRVLRPGGSAFVNLDDKYNSPASGQNGIGRTSLENHGRTRTSTARDHSLVRRGGTVAGYPRKSLLLLPERYRVACVDTLGLCARAVIAWDKPNATPDPTRDRVGRSHEDWLHLTRSERYFANIRSVDPCGRLPRSVWRISTEPFKTPAELGITHLAPFPAEWPRRLILGWSPPAGVVLDPCGGTGTTAQVADALGRVGVSLDLSADYSRLALSPELRGRRRIKALA